MPASIVLTGPMGSGKSSVGKLLAATTGMEFLDLDLFVSVRAGKTVNEIFEQDGEAAFRRMETEALTALAGRKNLVVSTGGGAVVLIDNRQLMRSIGRIINLTASLDALVARLADADDRPLLKGAGPLADIIAGIVEKREQCYADCDIRIDTTGKSVEDVAAELLDRISGD